MWFPGWAGSKSWWNRVCSRLDQWRSNAGGGPGDEAKTVALVFVSQQPAISENLGMDADSLSPEQRRLTVHSQGAGSQTTLHC